ncbi:MAG: helix-turn-helix domain-containing protein [Firmicutes bacterium]|nr:helix-turn-helix domain-containing protein [Bacillota bacterium]
MERLNTSMQLSGKTQAQISSELNVRHQKLSKWKLGYHEPCLHDLVMLADYFEVTTDYLLGRTNDYN